MSTTSTATTTAPAKKRPRVDEEEDKPSSSSSSSSVSSTASSALVSNTDTNENAHCYQVLAMPPAAYAKLKELEERAASLEVKTGVPLEELVRRLKHSMPSENT
eukprot:TRINITY_DN13278_c0_g1_i1.p1 TRINITY_DN13278_c0_g1~~TRINITY_DN13278_c0_g1_i1.p1  ORF type:complete len:104 (-),score=36.04 TRINITY_DN13278_c0_g1_i1:219-530(-)